MEAAKRRMPVRLNNDPLQEVVWSMRFETKSNVVETLPDIIFQAFPDTYKNVEKLQTSLIPTEFFTPNGPLNYIPLKALKNGEKIILLGNQILCLSHQRPYPGKKAFVSEIMTLCEVVKKSDLIECIQMISLKYVNFIVPDIIKDLTLLELNVTMCGKSMVKAPIFLQTKKTSATGATYTIKVISPVEIDSSEPGQSIKGILVDIDSSLEFIPINGSWDDIEANLNIIHEESKELFFSLLTDKTLESLGAVYD
jgi:uncharacterized protein (TIGR04255 family)